MLFGVRSCCILATVVFASSVPATTMAVSLVLLLVGDATFEDRTLGWKNHALLVRVSSF